MWFSCYQVQASAEELKITSVVVFVVGIKGEAVVSKDSVLLDPQLPTG